MVDGVDAGVVVNGPVDGQYLAQDFRDADMVVVGLGIECEKQPLKKDEYVIYSIYGNNVVESTMHISGLNGLRTDGVKVVLGNRKPYILSGD